MVEHAIAHLINGLATEGWATTGEFLDRQTIGELAGRAERLWMEGRMKPAGIGAGNRCRIAGETRGDHICWLDESCLEAAEAAYWSQMDLLRAALNRDLFLSLADFEAHYAAYAPGAFYRRHIDRFSHSDERVISSVLYLSTAGCDDAGQLRLHLETGPIDILPAAGRFVVFRSEAIPHEVMETRSLRRSIAAWFRRRGRGV